MINRPRVPPGPYDGGRGATSDLRQAPATAAGPQDPKLHRRTGSLAPPWYPSAAELGPHRC
jgi:hypothetical protein